MLYYGDKVFKMLQRCNKKRHIPGTECFRATIKDGFVLVECRETDVFIESFICNENGNEARSSWTGSITDAATHLESLEIDLSSVEALKRTLGSCLLLKKSAPEPIQYNADCEGFGKTDNTGEPCEFCRNCNFYHLYD